jgi:pimeloyl-ACP methyl ester carboxylesterase
MYVIDDLLPQANWPEGHAPKVPALIDDIERRPELTTVRLAWASGLMLCPTRRLTRRCSQRANSRRWRAGRSGSTGCTRLPERDEWPAADDVPPGRGPVGPAEDIGLIAPPWGFDLADVKVPALLWHGELDRNVPVVGGRYLAGALPNCRATFYAAEAHLSVPLNHQQ